VGRDEFGEVADDQMVGVGGEEVEETFRGGSAETGLAQLEIGLQLRVELGRLGRGAPLLAHGFHDLRGAGGAVELSFELIDDDVVGAVCDHANQGEAHVADR
jgi:hypothetical protein